MFKTLKKRIKNEKGLSLVELLAVIVILAIVAAIAIPAIGNIINNTRDKAVLSDVQSAISSAKIARADGSCSSETVCNGADLEFESENVIITTITFSADDVTVVATLDKAMSGTRIPAAIATAGGTSPGTGTALTITESQLKDVLD